MLTNFTDTKVVRRDPKGEQTYISVEEYTYATLYIRGNKLWPRSRVYRYINEVTICGLVEVNLLHLKHKCKQ